MVSPELQIFKCFGCFPTGSPVQTPDGLKNIEEIRKGDLVISGKGLSRKVLLTYERLFKGLLITAKVRMLGGNIAFTDDHNVFTLGQGYTTSYKYLSKRLKKYDKALPEKRKLSSAKYFPIRKVKAGELKLGQALLYPIKQGNKDIVSLDLKKYYTKILPNHGTKPRKINYTVPVEKDFLEIVGWYLSEGSTNRAYLRFSFNSKETKAAYEVRGAFKRLFGLKGSFHRRYKTNGLELTVCHSALANIFENLFGKLAENKKLPYTFTLLPKEKLQILLTAYWRGDGTLSRRGKKQRHSSKSITTVSECLSIQVRDILLKLGYFPSEHHAGAKVDKNNVKHRSFYTTRWYRNTSYQRYNLVYEDIDGSKYWVLPVAKLEKKRFTGRVYNLSVEADSSYLTPSFAVSNCGTAGDIFEFVQKIEGVDFHTALEELAEKAGVKLERERIDPDAKFKKQLYWVNEMAAKFYNYLLTKHVGGKTGLDYFQQKRGLSEKTIKSFSLGYAPDHPDILFKYFSKKGVETEILLKAGLVFQKENGEYTDKFRGRTIFPLTGIDGKVLGFAGRSLSPDLQPKYLNTAETPVYHKSFFIYGLDRAKVAIKKEGAVFVEGYMDVISAHEAGIANIVATSGTSLTQGQLKLISRYTNDLTFCFDTDAAGVAASFRGIELAENMGFNIKVAIIPSGLKDLDELIKSDPDKARYMFSNAVPAYDFLLFSIIKKYNKDSPEGKKKIMDEIVPWFSRIQNKVLLDHYTKEIAKELGLNEETVTGTLSASQKGNYVQTADYEPSENTVVSPQSLESYIIALLLKSSLDFIKTTGYKIDPQDFADQKLRKILEQLREYIKGDFDKFDPKDFKKTLDVDHAALFENLYLQEIDLKADLTGEYLKKEFELALVRLNKESARRQMQKLSEEIRLAEKSNDLDAVKNLTSEFESLKKQLK